MSLAAAIAVAIVIGFISLSYEIIWFRIVSFTSGGSPAAFGLLLAYYLAGLSVGAYVSRAFCSHRSNSAGRRQLRSLTGVVLSATVCGYLVVPAVAWLGTQTFWARLLPLITISAGLFGAALPIVSHLGIPADDEAGARLSYVYLSNILGSACGSLLTGFVLFDMYTTSQMSLGLALVGLSLAAGLVLLGRPSALEGSVFVICAGLAAATIVSLTPRLFDRLYERLLFKQQDNGERFADLVENRQGVVAVTKTLRVFGGGAYDGAISVDLVHDQNIIIRAYGAVAVHPSPARVLMVGLSTGAWAQIIANAPNVEHLTVIEINPAYLQLIRKYPQVRGLLANSKVTIEIDDGRRWLVHHPNEQFDLIVQNTTEHWRAHVTNLLSREYVTLIRSHLRPGGVFHFNTTGSEDAYKTAFSMFANGFRFVNFATVSDSAVRLDPARWRDVLLHYRIDGRAVLDLGLAPDRLKFDSLMAFAQTIEAPPTFIGLESRESMLSHLRNASVITDDNMLPEWRELVLIR